MSFMQTISVYLNQKASNTSLKYWEKRIAQSLFQSQLRFRTPSSLETLYLQLQEDIESGVDAIVSVGGDGTVNTLIQSLVKQDIGLLVIPGGTANDLAYELGTEKSFKKVIQYIRSGEFKKIDLIKINDRYMATNGGVGFAGTVAEKVNEIRRKFPIFKKVMKLTGKNIYTLIAGIELLGMSFDYDSLHLECEEFSGQVNCVALLVNNQPTLAGTFHVAPETNNQDGKFNVVILTHPSKRMLIRCVLRVRRGFIPKDDPHFMSFETKRLKVKNLNPSKKVKFFGDGEIFSENQNNWDITIEPKALKVYSKCSENSPADLVN